MDHKLKLVVIFFCKNLYGLNTFYSYYSMIVLKWLSYGQCFTKSITYFSYTKPIQIYINNIYNLGNKVQTLINF